MSGVQIKISFRNKIQSIEPYKEGKLNGLAYYFSHKRLDHTTFYVDGVPAQQDDKQIDNYQIYLKYNQNYFKANDKEGTQLMITFGSEEVNSHQIFLFYKTKLIGEILHPDDTDIINTTKVKLFARRNLLFSWW